MDKLMYNQIENYMFHCMRDAAHDLEHIFRVLYQSLKIASQRTERINYDVLIAACLLHDIGREK
ncbi:MAG: HD domain-containing protein, partial [Treponema sp.]|nr:HD domain-containing protein [Treponema sp.]